MIWSRFGLIPELIGRLPVVTVLDPLDEQALIRVLTEPLEQHCASVQGTVRSGQCGIAVYRCLALHAIAKKTIQRKSGARGLRSVVEELLIPIMYEIPSDPTIIRVVIDEDTVEGGKPHLEYGAVRKRYKNQAQIPY